MSSAAPHFDFHIPHSFPILKFILNSERDNNNLRESTSSTEWRFGRSTPPSHNRCYVMPERLSQRCASRRVSLWSSVCCLLFLISFCRDRLSCCFGSVDSFSLSQRTVFDDNGCLRTPRPRSPHRILRLSVVTVTTTTQALQGRVHGGTAINKCWPRTQFDARSSKGPRLAPLPSNRLY